MTAAPAAHSPTPLLLIAVTHRYGKKLVKKYEAFRNANAAIGELVLRVADCWVKLEIQLEFLHNIWDSLGEPLQVHQDRILNILEAKLTQASKDLERVLMLEERDDALQKNKKVKAKKFKFVVMLQECLEKTVDDLESWHRRFDPSWWLILRLKDHSIDRQLHLSSSDKAGSLATLKSLRSEITAQDNNHQPKPFLFVDEHALHDEREPITGSLSTLAYLKTSHQYVVVDTIICGPTLDPGVIVKDVQDLASILAKVNPSRFGLLSCYGAVEHRKEDQVAHSYDLLLNAPSEVNAPRSLRSILSENPSETPLNERIEIAAGLARAVLFLHASCFVHKSIRPDNILVFGSGKAKLGKPYLVGFEKFRLSTTMTQRFGDDLWEKNLYRHPVRQGVRPQEDFIMQHDVYSLGVVLLEIGLNTSFITWPEGPEERPVPNPQLEIADLISKRAHFGKARAIKEKFVALAETSLPNTFGQKYSEVVLNCLTCLDKNNTNFGDTKELEEVDEDGVLVGVRYIDKVCSRIRLRSRS